MIRGSYLSLLLAAAAVDAQQLVTIDGTSGAMTSGSTYNTSANAGGLRLSLGFNVEYLVVGGGGGGGGSLNGAGGGGGGGGYLTGSTFVTASSHNVSVGGGGSGGQGGSVNGFGVVTAWSGIGANGGNSSFSSITSLGGGGGGNSWSTNAGSSGGSGGGGGSNISGGTRSGGLGNSGQGYSGGSNIGTSSSGSALGGSSGGGAGGAGSSPVWWSDTTGATGGAGLASSISGTSTTYATGGWGGSVNTAGGGTNAVIIGGGGSGASVNYLNGNGWKGGNGANGIVIVRYLGSSAGTGGSVSTSAVPGYTVHTFTSTGNSTLDLASLNLSARLGTTLTGVISGSNDLAFDGPGRLTLGAANTYTGGTVINAGTLALGSAGSIANSLGISLASGSTLDVSAKSGFTLGSAQTLTGGGTIVGDTVIAGTHTPGFSPGLQTFSDNLTYANGSSVIWELATNSTTGRGTNFDGINVEGDLTFQGTVNLSLVFNYGGGAVDWTSPFWDSSALGEFGWKIFGVTGTINGFANLQLANASWLDSNGVALLDARPYSAFSLSQGVDGIYLNYSHIPEPSTYGLILGGLVLAGAAIRRRKSKS